MKNEETQCCGCGMTRLQSKQLYLAAGGPYVTENDYCESEWNDIHEEMEAIVAAKSDRAAAKVIEWWGCWDRKYTATAFARRVRCEYERKHGKAGQ